MDHLTIDVIQDRHTKEVLLRMELHFCTTFSTATEVLAFINKLTEKYNLMCSYQPELKGRTYCPTISTSKER